MKRKRRAEGTRDVLGSRMKTHDVCAARPCPDPGRRLRGRCAARGSAPRRLRRRSEDTWPGHLRGDAAAPPDVRPGPTRHQGAPHCPGGGTGAVSAPRAREATGQRPCARPGGAAAVSDRRWGAGGGSDQASLAGCVPSEPRGSPGASPLRVPWPLAAAGLVGRGSQSLGRGQPVGGDADGAPPRELRDFG